MHRMYAMHYSHFAIRMTIRVHYLWVSDQTCILQVFLRHQISFIIFIEVFLNCIQSNNDQMIRVYFDE